MASEAGGFILTDSPDISSLTSEKVPISLDIFHIYKYIPLDILPTIAAPTLIDKETSGHVLNQFYDKFKV